MKPMCEAPRDRYVLAKYAGGNWHDSVDPDGALWVIVRWHDPRRGCVTIEHNWQTFGPHSFREADLAGWCELPR